MRLRPIALVPVVLASSLLGVGACGQSASSDTGKFSGAEKDVAQTVYDLRDAIAKRDEGKVCDTFMTPALRDRVAKEGAAAGRGSTCAKAIQDSVADIDATDLTVEKVTITGTTATATIKTKLTKGPDPNDTLTLQNERGWRLSDLP